MLRYLAALALAFAAILGLSPGAQARPVSNGFTNPLFKGGDPWITRVDGVYYYTASNCGVADLCIKRSRSLSGLAAAPWIGVWSHLEDSDPNAHDVWAPELHYLDGHWYIYYAADDGSNERHRLYVLVADHAEGPYTEGDTGSPHGQLVESSGHWAIDPNVFTASDGKRYLTWSCTDHDDSTFPQRICLAPLLDPLHVGQTVAISTPTEAWEIRGKPIQEGPVGYTRHGHTYITYSASASWIPNNYAVGMLTLTSNASPIKPSSWRKSGPIFDHHGKVYGPGSVVFVPSPDGSQWWNVYHAIERLDCDPAYRCRDIRMQPMHFDHEGAPVLGKPQPLSEKFQLPAGDSKVPGKHD
ncbi:MAG: glycoside hydrolase family 43 protein [Rhodanobacter sp.]